MIDKWSSKFKNGPTNSTRKLARTTYCTVCGRKLPLLSGRSKTCSDKCKLIRDRAKYRRNKKKSGGNSIKEINLSV